MTELDNQIYFSSKGADTSSDFDSKFRLKFETSFVNGSLDFDNLVFVKVLVSRDKTTNPSLPSYELRVYLNNKNLSEKLASQSQHLACSLSNAGIDPTAFGSGEIVYNLAYDTSEFGKFMYAEYKDVKTGAPESASRLNLETYTFFFFFIPVKLYSDSDSMHYDNKYGKWVVVGSTAHFWPPSERVTIAAALRDGSVKGSTYVLPYEYLMNPTEFSNNYSPGPHPTALFSSPTTVNYSEPLFKINLSSSSLPEDAGAGKNLLFLQAVDHKSQLPSVIDDAANKPRLERAEDNRTITVGNCTVSTSPSFSGSANISAIMNEQWFNKQAHIVTFPDLLADASGGYEQLTLVIPQKGFLPNDGDPYNSSIPIWFKGLSITSFACNVTLDNGHWIPNTADKLAGIRVDLPITTNNGPFGGVEAVRLLAPEDPNFSSGADPSSTANIFKNKGDGLELYARFPGADVHLVTFQRKQSPASGLDSYTVTGTGAITVTANEGLANADGGYRLYRDGNGHLTFSRTVGAAVETTTEFAVRAVQSGSIRPGDDFLLRFGLEKYPGSQRSATAGAGGFVAVYDKKLLDYAHTFCNNSAISDWTRFDNDATVTDAVAYNWGGTDTVEGFNMKLGSQSTATTAYYAAANVTTISPNPAPSAHRGWSPWNATTAPGGIWNNYTFVNDGVDNAALNAAPPLTVNGAKYYPYLVGFAEYRRGLGTYIWQQVLISAGIDCSGFVQRCAGYAGNRYVLTDFNGTDTWDENSDGFPVRARHGTAGMMSDERSWLIGDQNLLVPGDILIKDGHVAFVDAIDYPSGTREVAESSESVRLIQATGDGKRVRSDRTWMFLGAGYFPRRIRIN